MNDTIEQEIQDKASAGPRVTPVDIEAEIASEHYFTAADGYRSAPCFDPNGQPADCLPAPPALELLTFCVLVLRNGTKVVGINHGAIDPAQHSAERGREDARKDAVNAASSADAKRSAGM
ncbi:MAG TPA: Gp49 family protein [Alicycliphilus sp.]|nr:Gp49 family protein [Alicycliphilus sp.]